MSKQLKLGSSDFWTTIGVVATVLGIGAIVVKALSKNQQCPACDRIISATSALQAVCPWCGIKV
jgi:hypothetical protein